MKFSNVFSACWRGESLRAVRGDSVSQVVLLYLMTCEAANLIGLFYIPLPLLCHETGLDLEGASKGLRRGSQSHFCEWDEGSETVFLPSRGLTQVGERLSPKDNRVPAILKQIAEVRKSPLFQAFWDAYAERWGLEALGVAPPISTEPKGLPSPFEGASKPLVSVSVSVEGGSGGRKKPDVVTVAEALAILDKYLPAVRGMPGVEKVLESYWKTRSKKGWSRSRDWWEKNVLDWREFEPGEVFEALRVADRSLYQGIHPKRHSNGGWKPPAHPVAPRRERSREEVEAEVRGMALETPDATPQELEHVFAIMQTLPTVDDAWAFGISWFGGGQNERRERWQQGKPWPIPAEELAERQRVALRRREETLRRV